MAFSSFINFVKSMFLSAWPQSGNYIAWKTTIKRDHSKKISWNQLFTDAFFSKNVDLTEKSWSRSFPHCAVFEIERLWPFIHEILMKLLIRTYS